MGLFDAFPKYPPHIDLLATLIWIPSSVAAFWPLISVERVWRLDSILYFGGRHALGEVDVHSKAYMFKVHHFPVCFRRGEGHNAVYIFTSHTVLVSQVRGGKVIWPGSPAATKFRKQIAKWNE